MALQAMGKTHIDQLVKKDLVSVDPVLARTLGIGYAGDALYLQLLNNPCVCYEISERW